MRKTNNTEHYLLKHVPDIKNWMTESIFYKINAAMQEYAYQFAPTQSDEGYTHIALLLDASSSMKSIKTFIINGFNEFIDKQRKVTSKCTISLSQFSSKDTYRSIYNFVTLDKVKELTTSDYTPDGMTSLNDSFVKMVLETENYIKNLNVKPGKVIFVSLSDGEDNDSPEYGEREHPGKFKEFIKKYENENGWEFSYIGANQDSKHEAFTRGMKASSSMNFHASAAGVGSMYDTLSKSMTSYRTTGKYNLDDNE
jgi:hypothetical protein